MDVLLRTAVVAIGGAALATLLASVSALLSLTKARFSNWCVGIALSSFLLLPTYLIAGAWSAGFGVQGWWTLSQVSAAKFPAYAIGSVVWIHAMAALPVAYWLLRIGLHASLGSSLETARLDGGFKRLLLSAILPAWWPWMIGTLLLISAWISGDMVVTNLFQVRTLAENCYLKMLSGEPNWTSGIYTLIASLFLGFGASWVFAYLWPRFKHDQSESKFRVAITGTASSLLSSAAWLIVFVAIFLPTINVIIKAGWVATEDQTGVVNRSWNPERLVRGTCGAPLLFAQELNWSVILAMSSAFLALLLGIVVTLCWLRQQSSQNKLYQTGSSGVFLAVLLGCFSLPGPVVTGLVLAFFQLPWPLLQTLNDQTLIAPIVCLQFKLVPLATLILTFILVRWSARHRDTWMLDQSMTTSQQTVLITRSFGEPVVALACLLMTVAFGELSSYLLCLPPGVTPISLRIFDLLHYGVRAGEAGLFLFLLGIGMAIGLLVTRGLQREL
jgi:iron(III) transport system permease protein